MKITRGAEWSTPSRVAVAAPATAGVTPRWLLRITLTCSFALGVAQYAVSSGAAAFVPLAGIAFCGLLVLCGRKRTDRVQHILGGGGLLFVAMLFGEVVSYTSNDKYSQVYGLVFVGLFLCARLIVQEQGVANIIRAYSQAGMLTVCLILVMGRQTLFAEQTRFSGGTRAHPNLIAFVLAGFFPVLVWRAMEEKARWKKTALSGLSLAAFGLMFLTGSRGSLSALLFCGAALLMRGIGTGWLRRFRIRHLHIIVLLIMLPVAVMFLLQHNRIGHIVDFTIDFLALNTSQRGLKSGLSGRTSVWQIAFRLLRARNRWLFGFGYRAGDHMVGTIDNGYIQLVFESGLIAGGLIFGSMLRVFFVLWKASSCRVNNAWNRYYLMLWCLMIVYFLNNISNRYLFSFGSPFSLCVLFLMAASRRELLGDGEPQVTARALSPSAGPASRSAVWNRSGAWRGPGIAAGGTWK